MKKIGKNLYRKKHTCGPYVAGCFCLAALFAFSAGAAVVQRPRPVAHRASNAVAMQKMAKNLATVQATSSKNPQPASEPENTTSIPDKVPEEIIENKTTQFGKTLGQSATAKTSKPGTESPLAEMIRQQREALDSAGAKANVENTVNQNLNLGQSDCDAKLRTCMQNKCGKDFLKCRGDSDTDFGTKLDTCRRDTKCSGKEYQLFSAEIKADRDMNARLSLFNKTLDCGNQYNSCIVGQCGNNFNKCLGKKAGDAAISKCDKIAKDCTEYDTGLAGRALQVFGSLRQNAEVEIRADEQKLYALRDKMSQKCGAMGAMFDERSLDCVYTVNFFAGDDQSTPFASKKLYAGGSFDCTPNWFGIDITTFKENALRTTREQKAASSALMGAGLGMATGTLTSGALDRAVDTKKAKTALTKAEKEKNGGKTDKQVEREEKRTTKRNEREEKKKCKKDGGTWNEAKSKCENQSLKS